MNAQRAFKAILVLLLIVGIVYVAVRYDARSSLGEALERVRDLGPAAPLAFAALYVVATVLFLPGSVLTLGAGVLFGVVKGTGIALVSATLGATAAFLVGRYLARAWVARKIEGHQGFQAIDEAVSLEGWKIVGLTRLSPVFPFNLLNYAYGITRVSLLHYVAASFVGMFPGTLMYVYLGSLAGDLAMLSGGGERTRTTGEFLLYGLGALATVLVTIYVTRIARKALKDRVE